MDQNTVRLRVAYLVIIARPSYLALLPGGWPLIFSTRRTTHLKNEEDHFKNLVSGTLLGALAGAGLGLGACVFIFEGTLLFTGDTVLFGAVSCGTLGYFLGDGFIDWLKDHIWWFW